MKPREEIVEAILRQLLADADIAVGSGIPPFIREIAVEPFRGMARDIVASGARFLIVAHKTAILCLQCGAVSHNPNDVAQRYCGACHGFLDEPRPPEAA